MNRCACVLYLTQLLAARQINQLLESYDSEYRILGCARPFICIQIRMFVKICARSRRQRDISVQLAGQEVQDACLYTVNRTESFG